MTFCFLNQPLSIACYIALLALAGALGWFLWRIVGLALAESEFVLGRRRRVLRSGLGVLATGICFAFFFESMFVRFSCAEVGADRITLRYFWPRQASVIPLNDVVSVEVLRDRKQRGELVVSNRRGQARSIVCAQAAKLEPAHAAIETLLQRK